MSIYSVGFGSELTQFIYSVPSTLPVKSQSFQSKAYKGHPEGWPL